MVLAEIGSMTGRYRRWVLACTLGEVTGFLGFPILGGALALWLGAGLEPFARALILYAVAVIGGLGEGAVLALFQLRVLAESFARLSPRRWVLGTAVAASMAWAAGMLAPTLDEILGISAPVQAAIWIPASILILLSIGSAQAWALRSVVENPQSWVVGNALGWLAGLPWTFVLPGLVPDGAPMTWWITAFAVSGVLMALTVGLVTGLFLLRLRPAQASGRQQMLN